MSDLIDRQAVIKAITNATDKWDCSDDYMQGIKVGIRMGTLFSVIPSAHPEIIRCKDCEDYQTDWETSYPNRHYCATMDSMMPEDGFCSYAERRTDE